MAQLEPVARNATEAEAQVVGWAGPGNPAAAGGDLKAMADLEAAEVEGGMPAPVAAEDGLPPQAVVEDSASASALAAVEDGLPPQVAVEVSASVSAPAAAGNGLPPQAAV